MFTDGRESETAATAAAVIRRLCLRRSFNLTDAGQSRHRRRHDEIRSVELLLLVPVVSANTSLPITATRTSANSYRQVLRHRLWVRDGICRWIDRYWQRLKAWRADESRVVATTMFSTGRSRWPPGCCTHQLTSSDRATPALTTSSSRASLKWCRRRDADAAAARRAWRLICDSVMMPWGGRGENDIVPRGSRIEYPDCAVSQTSRSFHSAGNDDI